MPRHTLYRIQWSSSAREYVVFRGGKLVVPRIEPGGQGWFAWLETISSFSFQCRSGEECTVRKEAVQRGGDYWYAYRRKGRRMVKRYLARSHDLTLARLEVVTAALNGSKASAGSSQLLLATKMHMPRLPVQHVARPRLLALLRQGVQGPLTLV
ncbi:MAG: LuxR family transcriptional regulator, partial [Ktedonobacteraceae bacterium]|nr:LuxR family transcriptional regulator [Ktedonobacteraceae bacterium]